MKRKLYLDIVKIVAILCVVAYHIDYFWRSSEVALLSSSLLSLFTVIGAMGVPLFVMTSGALIMGKNLSSFENIKRFYTKNLLSIYITGAIWYAIYYCYNTLDITGKGMLQSLLMLNKPESHLWYIRMILIYYLLMPLIVYMKNHWNKVFICIVVVIGLCLFGRSLYLMVNKTPFPTTSGYSYACYLVYMTIGYYISKGDIKVKRVLVPLGLLLLGYGIAYYMMNQNYFELYWYDNPLVLVSSVSLFCLTKRCFGHLTEKRVLTELSNMTFGVYLIHILLIYLVGTLLRSYLNLFVDLLLIIILSFIIVRISHKIPIISKYLFRY